MADKKEWKGTATELLCELEAIVRRPSARPRLHTRWRKARRERSSNRLASDVQGKGGGG